LRRGLVTDNPDLGKSATPLQAPAATQTFPVFSLERSLGQYLGYLSRFSLACVRAKWLMRERRLLEIVERIRIRRLRWANPAPVAGDLLQTLVRAHHHLRPLIYTAQDECLYDSLVLLEFLASCGVDATWVFCVHTRPWIPHCYVCAGSYVLNDSVTNVGRYSVLAMF
jgi:hypothetical protein